MDEIYEMKRYRCCNHVHKCGLTGWAGPTDGYMHYPPSYRMPRGAGYKFTPATLFALCLIHHGRCLPRLLEFGKL